MNILESNITLQSLLAIRKVINDDKLIFDTACRYILCAPLTYAKDDANPLREPSSAPVLGNKSGSPLTPGMKREASTTSSPGSDIPILVSSSAVAKNADTDTAVTAMMSLANTACETLQILPQPNMEYHQFNNHIPFILHDDHMKSKTAIDSDEKPTVGDANIDPSADKANSACFLAEKFEKKKRTDDPKECIHSSQWPRQRRSRFQSKKGLKGFQQQLQGLSQANGVKRFKQGADSFYIGLTKVKRMSPAHEACSNTGHSIQPFIAPVMLCMPMSLGKNSQSGAMAVTTSPLQYA